jgi:hypothetical protein
MGTGALVEHRRHCCFSVIWKNARHCLSNGERSPGLSG